MATTRQTVTHWYTATPSTDISIGSVIEIKAAWLHSVSHIYILTAFGVMDSVAMVTAGALEPPQLQ